MLRFHGYSIGGKSGTSEPLSGSEDEGYVASFVGFAPTVNTQLVVLVAIYDPHGDSHQGGQVAGPVVSQILTEVLPYLGIPSNDTTVSKSESSYSTNILPDVRNKTIAEAKKLLKESNFNVEITTSDEDENITIITDQMPKPGVNLIKNYSTVYLYTEKNNEHKEVTVPNFKGMSAAGAINSAEASNLNLELNGTGIVISQDVASRK